MATVAATMRYCRTSASATTTFLLIAIFAAESLAKPGNDCKLIQLGHANVTSHSFALTWKLLLSTASPDCASQPEGQPALVTFRIGIYYEHSLGCEQDLQDGPGKPAGGNLQVATFEVGAGHQAPPLEVPGLSPFTKYKVEMVGLLASGELAGSFAVATDYVETGTAAPGVPPGRAEDKEATSLGQAIQFYWAAPNGSAACHLQNGHPDGFKVELWGLDPWAASSQQQPQQPPQLLTSAKVPENVFQFYAHNLLPRTRYLLKVFNVNQNDLFDPGNPLEIEATTLPAEPRPPTELQATPTSTSSIHLRWVPSYPPTGLIEKYVVRKGIWAKQGQKDQEDQLIWRQMHTVLPQDNACKAGTGSSTTVDNQPDLQPFRDPFCYVLSGLTPGTRYAFQVQAFNANVSKGSEFSSEIAVSTEGTAAPDPTEPPDRGAPSSGGSPGKASSTGGPPDDASSEESPETTLAVIIALAILAVAVTIACVALRSKIRTASKKLLVLRAHRFPDVPLVNRTRAASGISRNSLSATFDYREYRPQQRPSSSSSPPPPLQTSADLAVSAVQQIQEIQRRRLPEPPPGPPPPFLSGTEPASQFSTLRVGGTAAAGYSLPRDDYRGPVCHGQGGQGGANWSQMPSSSEYSEYGDTEGYLRPTFRTALPDNAVLPPGRVVAAIRPEEPEGDHHFRGISDIPAISYASCSVPRLV